MSSTFGILEAAKSGLSVSMENLKITGHNIANANTVGYSRQRLVTSAKEMNASYLLRPVTNEQVGQGVEVLDVQQIRSSYLDDQYRDLNSGYSDSDATTQALTYLEGLFNPELSDGEGLTGAVESFFSALNTFTSNTSSEENRIAVQKSAEGMTQDFNLVYQEMESLWNDQNDSISTDAQEVNSIAEKLADLNDSIASYERRGDTANDLRDERNLLLDTLSGYADITYSNNTDNPSMVDVKIGGASLVTGETASKLVVSSKADHADEIDGVTQHIADLNVQIAAETDSATISDLQNQIADEVDTLKNTYNLSDLTTAANGSMVDVSYGSTTLVSGTSSSGIADAVQSDITTWADFNKNNLTLVESPAVSTEISIEAGTITSGSLYAHMNMVSSIDSDKPGVLYYMDRLNSLARSMAQNINEIHLKGFSYDSDGQADTTNSTSGHYFFQVGTSVDGSGNVTEDYSKITAGNFALSNDIEDNIWDIAGSSEQVYSDGTQMNSGNSEVATSLYQDLANSGYYGKINSIVGHLALALDTSQNLLDAKQSLLTSADTQRTSVSGVSQDEEATNLIMYQQSYTACARVITAIDEMLDTMINNMGVVGR